MWSAVRSSPRWLALSALLFATSFVVACGDDSEAPEGTAAALAERWLRVGEDHSVNVHVHERALPPGLVDVLNPNRTEDTPEADLVAFPVHPDGELLGSYALRREDGSHILWLFFDVPETTLGAVTATITPQLDTTPWQVVGEQGNRSFTVVTFESTRTTDLGGSAIAEAAPASGTFALVVERDGEQVTLEVVRAAPAPPIEAELDADLTVERVLPGLASASGLQVGDRIVRVAETEVSTRVELQRALEGLASGTQTVSIVYILQVAPPGIALPPFVPSSDLSLPEGFPVADLWSEFVVDEYQASRTPEGSFFLVSLLSEDSSADVSRRIREGLEASGWEIMADQAQGFATALQFANEDLRLAGLAQIDASTLDEALTQVFVQIQRAAPGGN